MDHERRPKPLASRFTFCLSVLLVALLLGPVLSPGPLHASRPSCGWTGSPPVCPTDRLDAPRPLGCLFTPPDPGRVRLPSFPVEMLLPDTVDLSAGLPPVGDQGAQASCVGWATTYYAKTYQEKRERGWAVRDPGGNPIYSHILSPAYVFNQVCVVYPGGVGAYIGDALEVLVSQGSDAWSQFPYSDADYQTQPTYSQRRVALPYQSLTYGAFFLSNLGDPRHPNLLDNDLQPLKAWLAGGNPVMLAIPVYAEFDAPAGPYAIVGVPANTLTCRGGHAILLVGYADNIGGSGVGGFKFVNSWSTAYGNGGYGYLVYDFVRQYVPEAWWMTDRTAQGLYSVCGHVQNVAGSPLRNTHLTLDGVFTVCTSADGFYGWGGLAAGDMMVTPSKPNYTFYPSASWADVATDVENVDFTGFSTNPAPLDCSAVIDAGVGGTFTGDTTGASFNVNQYNCEIWNESGPERVYRVTSSRTGTIQATLRYPPGPSTDLDVFILAACDESTCLAAGTYQASGVDRATVSNAPLGTYTIVVDGYNGARGPYTLSIEVPVDRPYIIHVPLVIRE